MDAAGVNPHPAHGPWVRNGGSQSLGRRRPSRPGSKLVTTAVRVTGRFPSGGCSGIIERLIIPMYGMITMLQLKMCRQCQFIPYTRRRLIEDVVASFQFRST
ncbi:hypothetical protein R1flu_028447 [Riccia fluitans]|uniref:Uncharacterized protein n=1 Tax=Riccia fluitans TaxID=41844 RepID=A0ABD1XLQ5_9MARC